jgi:hypothetical protein
MLQNSPLGNTALQRWDVGESGLQDLEAGRHGSIDPLPPRAGGGQTSTSMKGAHFSDPEASAVQQAVCRGCSTALVQ